VTLAATGAALKYPVAPHLDPLFALIIQCAQGLRDESHLADYLRGRYIKEAGVTIPGSELDSLESGKAEW